MGRPGSMQVILKSTTIVVYCTVCLMTKMREPE
ncbi:uncharacterized protein G2W53_015763 [Senna tora]|uniref:Uncharacterized protein n=1 Tax=Senna tora TaxID=362788 RepID=A0A835C8A3_9FABA|nr:uncharacterized protein G2W53_015763 [Senna tora]